MPMVNGKCEENAHAFITLHKDRIVFRVMLPYGVGSYISGSDPITKVYADKGRKTVSFGQRIAFEDSEEKAVGKTIIRLIRLNGVRTFDVRVEDDLPDAVEYRGGEYGND